MFHELLRQNASRGGETFRLNVAGFPVIVVQEMGDVHAVLRATDVFIKDLDWLRQMIGPSRFSENGAAWRVRRDLTDPTYRQFDKEFLKDLASRRAMDLIRAPDIDLAIYQLVLDLFLEVHLGLAPDAVAFDAEAFRTVSRLASANNFLSDISLHRADDDARRETLRHFGRARNAAIASLTALRAYAGRGHALIDNLLSAEAEGTTGRFELELLPTIIAGVDTTAAAMLLALKTLALQPDLVDMLRSLGPDASARFGDAVLRNMPSSPILSRISTLGTTLPSGMHVASGERLILCQINPDALTLVENARLIRAELIDSAPMRRSFPFSAGQRSCPGAQFARILMTAVLDTLVDQCELSLDLEGEGALACHLSLSAAGTLALSARLGGVA